MIELSCPSCSAPFEVPDDAAPTVTCSYCGTSFERPARPRSARRDTITGLAIGALALAVGIIGAGVLVWYVLRTARSTAPDAPDQPAITAPGANDHPERQLATRTLLIGQKGEGPGRFDDNRTIAVDTAGRIYTAEYDDGWLQSFDATGTFAALWRLDDEKVVLDLLADRSGHLYVLYPQQVVVYSVATGAVERREPEHRATVPAARAPVNTTEYHSSSVVRAEG